MKASSQITLSTVHDGDDGLSLILGQESYTFPCNPYGITFEKTELKIPFYAMKGTTKVPCSLVSGAPPTGFTVVQSQAATATSNGILTISAAANSDLGGKTILAGNIPLKFWVENLEITKNFGWNKAKEQRSKGLKLVTADTLLTTEDNRIITTSAGTSIAVGDIFDITVSGIDTDSGWVFWNEERIPIDKFSISFSAADFPHNTLCYVVYRTGSSTPTPYVVWHYLPPLDEKGKRIGDPHWKYHNITPTTEGIWNWQQDRDIVIATLEYRPKDNFVNASLFSEPKKYFEIRLNTMVNNWAYEGLEEGGELDAKVIRSQSIISDKLATEAIKSQYYSIPDGMDEEKYDGFSIEGSFFNLKNGVIRTPNLYINNSNAIFKGEIEATSGKLGGENGWSITNNTITSYREVKSTKMAYQTTLQSQYGDGSVPWHTFYIRTKADNSNQWDYPFQLKSDGSFSATKADISGGKIGGFRIDSNGMTFYKKVRLNATDQDIDLDVCGIRASNKPIYVKHIEFGSEVFSVSTNGNVMCGNLTCITSSANEGILTARGIIEDGKKLQDKYQLKGNYAPLSHTHTIANITNLQATLNGKAPATHLLSGSHMFGLLSGTTCRMNQDNDGKFVLGASNARWGQIYSTRSSISTSDENEKDIHSNIDERYENAFMDLEPIIYSWRNFDMNDTHDRRHIGFGAQTVEKVFTKNGISTQELGAVCKDVLDSPTKDGRITRYGLRYEEFIPLLTHMVQKTISEKEQLASKITILENSIKQLQNECNKQ